MYFGCLILLLVGVFFVAINLLSSVLNLLGGVVVYLWESLCNLFRPKEKRRPTHNPFSSTADSDSSYTTAEAPAESLRPHGKVFDATDGEYVDFEEVEP